MEFTREDYVRMMQHEAKAALRFAARAEELIEQNILGAAIDMLDTAVTASKCAMQAHEKFWEIQNDDITEAEFKAIDTAEHAQIKVRAAVSKYRSR